MRLNLPVTAQEYRLPEGHPALVSVTDTKGRITYCNAAFVEVSGYTAEELLGQPHNLVRHPDMPAEAYRDLWATIETGRPWTGLVKNRRKNGDHYWVRANAAPLMEGQRITGYLSVRGVPGRAEVAAAEALYAQMRAEAGRGRLVHVLRHGAVLRTDALGRLRQALTIRSRARVALLQGLLALGAGVAAVQAAPLGWLAVALALAGVAAIGAWGMQRLFEWAERGVRGERVRGLVVALLCGAFTAGIVAVTFEQVFLVRLP